MTLRAIGVPIFPATLLLSVLFLASGAGLADDPKSGTSTVETSESSSASQAGAEGQAKDKQAEKKTTKDKTKQAKPATQPAKVQPPGDVLESPRSVTQTLKPGDGLLSPQFRSRFIHQSLKPLFDLKEGLKEKYNLNLGLDYTVIGQVSTSDVGKGAALGQDLRFYGTWTPVYPKGPNSGSLTFKVESRKGYIDVAPQDLGFNSGVTAITAVAFSNAGWVLTNFYWKQRVLGDRLTFGFGQVDVTDYTDLFPLANSRVGFQNLVFEVNPAIPAPNQGLGAAAGFWFSGHFYGIGGIADANGDPSSPNFDVFQVGETFKAFEIGYTPSRERQFLDNVHVTVWQQDKRVAAHLPEDWGISASWSWVFRDAWAPFVRAGYDDSGVALYRRSVSAGVGYLTPQQDLFGFGVNWGRPGLGGDQVGQWTLESFYKYQISQALAISVDGQMVDTNRGPVGFFGLRLRVVL